MSSSFFADAWFFIALTDRFDSHHAQARRILPRLLTRRTYTTDAVLTELLAYFARHGAPARAHAAEAVRDALRELTVVASDSDLFARALSLYEQRPDKAYSLTDCMSMVVMRDRGITHVLSNDHHFRQEGFTLVNE